MEILKAKDAVLAPLLVRLPKWITPNGLAVFRLFMIIPITFFAVSGQAIPTAFLLITAFATDVLDGALARVRNQVTKAGAILDPIADKTIFLVLFWVLGWGAVDARIFVPLLCLELIFFLAGPAILLLPKRTQAKRQVGANIFGKLKTAMELVGLLFLILEQGQVPYAIGIAQLSFSFAIVFLLASTFRHLCSTHNTD